MEVAPDGTRTTYSYDNNGNLTVTNAAGSVTTFTWDAEDRLLSITRSHDARVGCCFRYIRWTHTRSDTRAGAGEDDGGDSEAHARTLPLRIRH